MGSKQPSIHAPRVLRAHRPPAQADTLTPLRADVQQLPPGETDDLPTSQSWLRQHLHQVGLGMLLVLALRFAGTQYVLPFVQENLDHWQCGAPPGICQFDLNVGHGGTTHFLTQYWHNQVILIETPPTDPENTKVYSAAVSVLGDGNAERIVTLQTAYLSRHPLQGKPDIVAMVTGFGIPVIFYNTGNGFSTEAR